MTTVDKKKDIIKSLCVRCNKLRKIKSKGLCEPCFQTEYKMKKHLESPIIPCVCNCGEMIHSINSSGYPAKFKHGHNWRGLKRPEEYKARMRLIPHKPNDKRNTKPENIVYSELDKLGISYIKQKHFTIRDFIHPVDIFIFPNILIEIDGNYWHSKLINRQIGIVNIHKDYIIDYELEKIGYKLYRFWEFDVYKNLSWVMNQITKILKISNYRSNDLIDCGDGCGAKINRYDKNGKKRYFLPGHGSKRTDGIKRQCCECGSYTTVIAKTAYTGKPYEVWNDLGDNRYRCSKCYKREYRKRRKLLGLPCV